ncbi:UNVERIFIED_CONTAM: hypothetical protein Sradi_1819800 [Sesamum radiatum]|uniref:Uncharacterized protein n=1 Tax=Sesamum radiatum TaxID=300843 RepID=A0AAW2TWB6_SESRA
MEMEKRKRVEDGEAAAGKRGKGRREDGAVDAVPGDEEVEEFFAILRRMQVALKYFENRNAGGQSRATPWRPAFEREDFAGVKNNPEGNRNAGLDLNSDPASDVSDSV